MLSTKLNFRTARNGLVLLCIGLLLAGCGGHGSVADGNQYLSSGKYRAAYIEAKKILQNDSKNGDAWLLLGKTSLMLGNPKEALVDLDKANTHGVPLAKWAVPMGRALLVTQQYDKLLKTIPANNSLDPKTRLRVTVLRGNAERGLKHFDKARQMYQAALKLDPKDAGALVGLAKLATIAGDTASASNYLKQALAASPDNPQAWVVQGDLAFNSHDFTTAEADYQKVLGFKHADWLPQERFYALARLANTQAQQNQLDKALDSIKTLEKMAEGQPYPHYLHAVVLYKQGHLDDAVSQLQKVLQAAPNNLQAQMLMGAVNYAQGHYAQAQMQLSNVMGINSGNVDARKLLALTFYREGRSQQALDTLRPIVKGKPSDTELLAQLQKAAAAGAGLPHAASHPPSSAFTPVGKALASGDNAKAVELLQAMPKGDETTETQRNGLLVMTYLREQKVDKAVQAAAAFVASNPKDSSAHLLYGTALIAANKREPARAQYNEAIKLNPKNRAALLSLGSLEVLEGHDDKAAARYESVVKLDPRNLPAMNALGQLATQTGDKATAIKWFNQAIQASPKSPVAYLGLVKLYNHGGQFDQALATAKRLAKAAPHNPAALNAVGAAELNAGHHQEALAPLQQAVKLAPKVATYRTNLARAQILNKDSKDAATNLDAVIKATPTAVSAVSLSAFLKLQQHDLPGAIALAKGLQQHAPTKLAGQVLEGDLYMANKSWDKAADAYAAGLKTKYSRPLVVKNFDALAASGSGKADSILKDWLAKHPKDAPMRLLLGQYYLGLSRNAQAAGQYQQVLKAYPSNIAALNNLAWIYTQEHNPKALTLAEKAHKLAPKSAGVADTYGWALISRNQSKAALPILMQAAKAAPKVPTIQYHLAVAQARTGDTSAARTTLAALHKSGAKFKQQQAAEALYKQLGGGAGK